MSRDCYCYFPFPHGAVGWSAACNYGISWSYSLEPDMRFPTVWSMCDLQKLRPACAYAQSDQSPCKSLEYSMTVKLLTEYHLEFQSLKGGCSCSSESTFVKMSHCWKSHVAAHLLFCIHVRDQEHITQAIYKCT